HRPAPPDTSTLSLHDALPIYLVLAKRAGAPDNVRGISLFVVPKFLVNDDGSLGERNPVSCGALEKKMGIHGNSTCVLNYDGAKGDRKSTRLNSSHSQISYAVF